MIDLDHGSIFSLLPTCHSHENRQKSPRCPKPHQPASPERARAFLMKIPMKTTIPMKNSSSFHEIFANGSKNSDDIPIPGGRQCKQRAAVHRCKWAKHAEIGPGGGKCRQGGRCCLRNTPGTTNIAAWKMDPEWRCISPLKMRIFQPAMLVYLSFFVFLQNKSLVISADLV